MVQSPHRSPVSTAASLAILLGGCSTPTARPAAVPPDAPAFLQACKDATTDALVVNLAAHPDDEAARSLVFLRRKFGIRTVTVYSTCGEGGQNAIGREIGTELARIRTRETLAAASFTGTQVRWLGFADFGYSKTAEETFRAWGRERYLTKLKAVLDEEQPDLVLTNHSPGRGHGHHRASVLALREVLAQEAVAGRVIPVYQRAVSLPRESSAADASARPKLDADIKFDVGSVDYMTGLTYARQASLGWRQHRTQGAMGAFSDARRTPDSWKMVLPAKGDGGRLFAYLGTVFDEEQFKRTAAEQGLDLKALAADFQEFHRVGDPAAHVARATRMLPGLENLVEAMPEGLARERLRRRVDALQRVVLEGMGLKIRAELVREKLAPGSRGHIEVVLEGGDAAGVSDLRANLNGVDTVGSPGGVRIPFGPLDSIDTGSVAPSWFRPQLRFQVGGVAVTRTVPVRFTAVPQVALELSRPVRFVPSTATGKTIEASVQIEWNGQDAHDAGLKVRSTNGFVVALDDAEVHLPAEPMRTERKLQIQLPDHLLRGDEAVALALGPGRSELRLRPVEVRAPANLRVGLIRGPDDTLQLALADLDIPFDELDKASLPGADLAKYSTLVFDIRAYRTRTDLRSQRDRLLAWCRAGGRVLCFYHKPNEWNATESRPLLAPFSLRVGRQRVCEEGAKVVIRDPNHRLWNVPNRIEPADFDGWVQERGLNFPSQWDDAWVPMLSMADTGEKALDGALLYAEYGSGDYIYCSLALYRQLRQGHAGSARLLVNLLAK